jgi:hypothetical protein
MVIVGMSSSVTVTVAAAGDPSVPVTLVSPMLKASVDSTVESLMMATETVLLAASPLAQVRVPLAAV